MMGNMRPTFANGNKATISKLLEVRRQAQKDKEPRVVLRIQGILMSLDGQTTGEIANHLKVHRSTRSAVDRSLESAWRERIVGGASEWAAPAFESSRARAAVRHFR